MRNTLSILLLLFPLLLVIGCKERHSEAIDAAYHLTETDPDSALSVLSGIERQRLDRAETARYTLVYSIAQGKAWLDVDNDSLIRVAYNWYNARPEDSLYAKCEYYMGKYYALNDSSEMAIECLMKSANSAEKQGDKYTQCLALDILSKVMSYSDPKKALTFSRKLEKIYFSLPNASGKNKVYCKLRVSNVLMSNDSLESAKKECEEAINIAISIGDDPAISDAYQDMSLILREEKEYAKSLQFAKKAIAYAEGTPNVSKLINLAASYLKADSLAASQKILYKIKTNDQGNLYTMYYIKLLISIKNNDIEKAKESADSAYYFIEQMYEKELYSKEKYYNSLVKLQYFRGMDETRSELMAVFTFFAVLSASVIIILILYSYHQYKIKTQLQIHAQAQEQENERQMHREELKHKEIQFETMRNYILKKIDIAKKIEDIRDTKNKHLLLAEEDWEEIGQFVDNVDNNFVSRLKIQYPNLTNEDVRFMILIRLNMSAKTMSMIYGISEKSIKQRLFVYKAKVGIEGSKTSLRSFIESF